MSEPTDKEKSWPPHAIERGTKDRVIHEYDGIQEYDNRLPNWWLYTLFGSVLFAGFYWTGYQVLAVYDLPNAEYQVQLAAAKEREAKEMAATVTPDALLALARDPAEVNLGKETFVMYCAPCHNADGSGKVGPNLTDAYWLHGGAPDQIFTQIMQGSPTKGMIAWGPQLGASKVKAATAFVLSIKNTNVPGGKPPQGELEK